MGNNIRALLIEDEELIGMMIRLNLENAGFEVAWAKSCVAAQEHLLSKPDIGIILLDIALPGCDGMTFLEQLRHNRISIPVMMLTANSEVTTKVSALEKGADDYLPKPFDTSELVARVRALVRRSGKRSLASF